MFLWFLVLFMFDRYLPDKSLSVRFYYPRVVIQYFNKHLETSNFRSKHKLVWVMFDVFVRNQSSGIRILVV